MTRLSLLLALSSATTASTAGAIASPNLDATASLNPGAATTPAPIARAAVSTLDPDVLCASSWWSWRNASASSSLSSWSADRTLASVSNLYSTSSYSWTRSSQVILYSTKSYTECDGIPRYSLKITGYSTTTESGVNIYSARPFSHYFDDHPLPTCSLTGSACYDNWRKINDLGGTTNNLPFADVLNPQPKKDSFEDYNFNFFGCEPPADLCEAAFGRCAVYAQAIALVYFQPRLKRRDLCGNDGHGIFEPDVDESAVAEPKTFVTTALTVDRQLSYGDIKKVVLTGQWTFTSPTVYVAYAGVNAQQRCRTIGSTYSGVMPVPVSELQTISYRPWEDPPKEVWNGSDLQFAQSMAAGLLRPGYHGNDETPVPINIADLEEPIPAVNYFQQLGDCRMSQGNCSAIVEGDHFPQFVPPSRLWGLDTAWSSCTVSNGRWMWDPPIELSTTTRPRGPTAPAWATHSRITSTAIASSPDPVNPATPGGSIPALPMVTGEPPSSRTSGQRIAQEPPGWQGPAIPSTATKIRATPIGGNPGVFAIGSNLLVDGGSGYKLSGQAVSLGQGGLIFGTRTLSIEYATTPADLRDLIASGVAPVPLQQGEADSTSEDRLSPGAAQDGSQESTPPSRWDDGNIDGQNQDQSLNSSRSSRSSTIAQGQAHAAENSSSAISTSKKSGSIRRRQVPALIRLLRDFWT